MIPRYSESYDAQCCFYETIRDKGADAVHLLFDLERDFSEAEAADEASRDLARGSTWSAVAALVEGVVREASGDPTFALVPGTNCQVLESVYPHKFSRHLLVYAADENIVPIAAKQFAIMAHNRCVALPAEHPERALLTYKSRSLVDKDKLRSIVDVSIYTMNRPMRMAFSCKRNKFCPLLPVLGSSSDIAAHLVTIVPPELFVPPQRLPPLDLKAIGALAVASVAKSHAAARANGTSGGAIIKTDGNARAPAEQPQGTPHWQPSEISWWRDFLLTDVGVASKLGTDRIEFYSEKTSADGNVHYFNLKPKSCACPYRGGMHKNNNMSLIYVHAQRHVLIHCHDADCREEPYQTIKPNASPFDVAAAIIDVGDATSSSATLHACEHLVEYREGDRYCEERMRPYPNDRLVAVRAGMGTGGFAWGGVH